MLKRPVARFLTLLVAILSARNFQLSCFIDFDCQSELLRTSLSAYSVVKLLLNRFRSELFD